MDIGRSISLFKAFSVFLSSHSLLRFKFWATNIISGLGPLVYSQLNKHGHIFRNGFFGPLEFIQGPSINHGLIEINISGLRPRSVQL